MPVAKSSTSLPLNSLLSVYVCISSVTQSFTDEQVSVYVSIVSMALTDKKVAG